VVAKVDPKRRKAICRSHTATHLLQATLRNILGSHVKQSGSLVAPDRLRFDFTHLAPLDERELLRVEEIVNEQIREGFEIKTFFTTKEEAIKQGAIALFEEEYAEWVRVVKIGDISMELCGGTHLRCSGEIGLFKIVGEVGVAAGVRRIEALVGESAYRLVLKREEIIRALSEELKVEPDGVLLRMRRILEEVKEAERQLDRMRRESMRLKVSDLLSEALQIGDIKVVCAKVEEVDSSLLREMADSLISKLKSGVVVLGTIKEGRALLVSKVTEDLTSKIHAGTFVREIAKVVGGGGGGRADMGEAGGRDFSKLDEALKGGIELIRNKLR
jgi:alanyl-tRNA synthetase